MGGLVCFLFFLGLPLFVRLPIKRTVYCYFVSGSSRFTSPRCSKNVFLCSNRICYQLVVQKVVETFFLIIFVIFLPFIAILSAVTLMLFVCFLLFITLCFNPFPAQSNKHIIDVNRLTVFLDRGAFPGIGEQK